MDIYSKDNRILMISYDLPPRSIWGQGHHVNHLTSLVNSTYSVDLCSRDINLANKLVNTTSNKDADAAFLSSEYLKNESYTDFENLMSWNMLLSKQILNHYNKSGKRPFLIHNHNWMTYKAAKYVANSFDIPLVTSLHFLEKQYNLSNFCPSSVDFKDIISLEEDSFSFSRKIIVFGNNHKNFLINNYNCDSGKVVVIPHGVPLEKYKSFKSNSSLEKEKIFIAFAGRLVPEKGICELIESIVLLHKQYPNIELNVMGEGVLKENLERIYPHDYIKFKGFLQKDHLLEVYKNIDIFCSISYTESFGLSVLEAMACGIPIITTRGDTIEPILCNDEALFVDLFYQKGKMIVNKKQLNENLAKMISSLEVRKRFSIASLKASEQFSDILMKDRTLKVYEELLDN